MNHVFTLRLAICTDSVDPDQGLNVCHSSNGFRHMKGQDKQELGVHVSKWGVTTKKMKRCRLLLSKLVHV